MKNISFSVLMATALVTAAIFLSSCSQTLEQEDILFTLPQWPSQKDGENFPPLCFWEISLFDGTEKIKFTLEKDRNSFSISETEFSPEKNGFFTVTARPITLSPQKEETAFFKAAGTVYPHLALSSKTKGTQSPAMELTWQDGFTAFIADQILEPDKTGLYREDQRRNFCRHFNWKKFSDCLKEKGKDASYNPWLCDKARIVSSICGKRFSQVYLNVKKSSRECESPLGGGFSSYVPAKKLSE